MWFTHAVSPHDTAHSGPSAAHPGSSGTPPRINGRETASILGAAAIVGAVAAFAATLFSTLLHQAEHLLWDTLPESLGMEQAPWWWVALILTTGAVGVWGARKMYGGGGHHPLDGLAFDITPRALPSTLLAAFATLAFGAVVGPEAPLLAIGTSVGFFALRGSTTPHKRILVVAGAAAALGVVMGNPLITVLLILEASLLMPGVKSPRPLSQLVPVMVALGTGYLVRVGVAGWPGMNVPNLSTGDLGAYSTVKIIDLVVGVVVALLAGGLVILATRSAAKIRPAATRRPLIVIITAALLIAVLAIAARAITGENVDTILFSGQTTMPTLVGASAATLVVIALAKAAAYALSLGAGFRGGAIFPAVYIGMAVGVLGSMVPGATLPGLVACGIAAGAAATLGMPLTATMLAALLTINAGPAVTVTAILGAVVGLLLKVFLDRARDGVLPDLPGVDEASPRTEDIPRHPREE